MRHPPSTLVPKSKPDIAGSGDTESAAEKVTFSVTGNVTRRHSGRPYVGDEPAPPPPDDSPPDAPIAEALRLRAMGVLARRLPVAMALLDDRDLLRLEDDLDRVLAEGLKAYKIDTRRKRRKDLRKS